MVSEEVVCTIFSGFCINVLCVCASETLKINRIVKIWLFLLHLVYSTKANDVDTFFVVSLCCLFVCLVLKIGRNRIKVE